MTGISLGLLDILINYTKAVVCRGIQCKFLQANVTFQQNNSQYRQY